MNEVAVKTKEQAPLDELMLAMDVVDTLRHRELVLTRELESEDRDREMIERLREIYTGQGIVVTDEVLAQGVSALREDRFVYEGPEPGFGRSLATLYVTRGRWGKWVGGLAAIVIVGLLAFQFLVRGPELRAIGSLPVDLQSAYQSVVTTTDDARALSDARGIVNLGEAAIGRQDYDAAGAALVDLRVLNARLEQQYELRVVSRPGELSGVWLIPDENTGAQNFYLIVQAIEPDGDVLTLPIKSEMDGDTERVSRWGLRVDEETFQRVAADKGDDGIIQNGLVGRKHRGELEPDYTVATTGATITEW